MAKKTCSDCVHCDVCENTFSWLDQEDNTKYITCHHFKNKADVVEVVRCEECKYWGGITFGNICRRWTGLNEKNCTKPTGFCSYGEKRSDKNGKTHNKFEFNS